MTAFKVALYIVALGAWLHPAATIAQDRTGECYSAGHVPVLSAGTRVFVVAELQTESTAADGRKRVAILPRPSMVVAKTAVKGDDLTLIPGAGAVTVRAQPKVCAYAAGITIPAEFANRPPDLVIQ